MSTAMLKRARAARALVQTSIPEQARRELEARAFVDLFHRDLPPDAQEVLVKAMLESKR